MRLKLILIGVLCGLWGCTSEAERLETARARWGAGDVVGAEAAMAPLFTSRTAPSDSSILFYGEILVARGELRKARNHLTPYVQPGANTPLPEAFYPHVLALLSHTHFYLGNPDTARVLAGNLRRYANVQADTVHLASAHHLLGKVAFFEAAYDSARYHQEQSFAYAKASGSRQHIADAMRQMGVLQWYAGHPDEAETMWYEPALTLYRAVGDRHGEATTLSNIGLLYLDRKAFPTFLRYQLQAFELRQRLGDQIGLSDSYYFLTINPYNHLPFAGHAFHYLQKSAQISDRIGYAWGREVAVRMLHGLFARSVNTGWPEAWNTWLDSTHVLSGEGLWHRQQFEARSAYIDQRWEEAVTLYEEQYAIGVEQGNESNRYHALQWLVRPLVYTDRWTEAWRTVAALQEIAPHDIRHVITEAELHIAAGNPELAAERLKPLTAAQDSLYLNHLYTSHRDVAFTYAAWAIHENRSDLYTSLTEALITQRDPAAFHFMERERGLPFWGSSGPYQDAPTEKLGAFIRSVETHESNPKAFTDLKTVESVIAEMQQAMLVEQQWLTDMAPPPQALHVTTLDSLQAALAPHEVYVAYSVTQDPKGAGITHPFIEEPAVHTLVVRQDTVAFIEVPTPKDRFATLLDVFHMALQRGQKHAYENHWQASAHSLYQMLLQPLEENGVLTKGDHLLLSPHQGLQRVPFQALSLTPATEAPVFAMERYTLSYVPSGTALVRQRQAPPLPLESLLALAPTGETLPYTLEEVRALPPEHFVTYERLEGTEASRKSVLFGLGNYDIVHLATHAQMHQRYPLYSFIQLHQDRLELHELLDQPVQAALVVLSACDTGRGVGAFDGSPSSDDLVSFPRAFLHAGAQSVLTSLWRAEDAATAAFMAGFYQQLGATSFVNTGTRVGLAQALTLAQRQFLAQARAADSKYQHPFFWAGFTLTGDSR